MLEPNFRGRVYAVALAALFAGACKSTVAETHSELPGPCKAAALADDLKYPALLSPAQGSVVGSEIVARLCEGGASAYIYRSTPTTAPPNQLLMNISSYTVDSTRDFDIASPTDAVRLQFSIMLGLDAARPGASASIDRCEAIYVCAIRPVPPSVQCPSTLDGDVCPSGCQLGGADGCVPIEPATCYDVCDGETMGSWHLNLSSVEPYTAPDSGAPGDDLFVTHGTFDATLVANIASGAAPAGTERISLSF